MYFLLNDRVLNLDPSMATDLGGGRFQAITPAFAIKLGQELFSENPLLHREDPDRAHRLAILLALKSPDLNAALFVAPAKGCRPDQVMTRFANLSLELIHGLKALDERAGGMTAVQADREVWRRMAA